MRWYDHNDLEDMERVLARVVKEQAKKPLTRRFIVTEGLFEDVGDVVDLPKTVSEPHRLARAPPQPYGWKTDANILTDTYQIELKLRYKFRLILDETWSFGVLGRTGRGLTEHQNVDAAEVDMIVGSLAGPLCAGGGFCVGSDEIVEHQRISAAAYTFSAALPAMLATTASETLTMLQTTPDILVQSRENVKSMWAQLDPRSDWVVCTSAPQNPMMLLVLKPEVVAGRKLSIADQEHVLQDVVDEVGFLLPHRKTPLHPRMVFWLLPLCLLTDFPPSTDPRQRRAHHPSQEHAPCWLC